MYEFLSSTQVISPSLIMDFFGTYGSLPDTAIWWCLRTGGAPLPKNVGRLNSEYVDREKGFVFFMQTTC